MKKKILILSMLATMSSHVLADGYGYMVFTLTDGSMQSIAANGLNLSFGNGKLTATSGTEIVAIPLESLQSMAFSKEGLTGIQPIDYGQLTIDDSTEIYNLRGQKVSKEQMQRGIYIVKTKERTYKMIVK